MRMIKKVALLASALALPSAPAVAKQPSPPNILLVVADDMGFSDLGAFGGEIATPNLDAIARRGIRLTSFYTAPTCSPSRAMLLTGQDHHAVGMGTMDEVRAAIPEFARNPHYTGHLDPTVPTIAEKLTAVGYRTMMAGKWHLGSGPGLDPAHRGFQQSYALMGGASDHFGGDQDERFGMVRAVYSENGRPVSFPKGQYTGDYFTQRMLGFLKAKPRDRRPFFAYMAFTEPHWPLQAPERLIDKYRGRYNGGPAALRRERLVRMKALGLLDDHVLGATLEKLEDWEKLPSAHRKRASRAMEIYAAMVDSLDRNVGKLIGALKKSGEFDNTVIVFVSDNGADGSSQNALDALLGHMGVDTTARRTMAAANVELRRMGRPGSYLTYGAGWAQAGSAPFHYYKGYTDEGGIRVPAIIAGPAIKGGRIVDSVVSQRDIMPTLLALAGSAAPIEASRVTQDGDRLPDGRSLIPILSGEASSVRGAHDSVAWELFFRRAIRVGAWKGVYRGDGASYTFVPEAGARWRLFDLAKDPGESTDVSASHPDVLKRLTNGWWEYARQNGVYVPDSSTQGQDR